MVCPRCRVAALCRRQGDRDEFVCRNRACGEHGKTIFVRNIEVRGETLDDINAGDAEKSKEVQG